MNLAVMQPYLFPYLGYFQLIHAADAFVFLDDVKYIKQGWINRNRLQVHNRAAYFSVPVQRIRSDTLINEARISRGDYPFWRQQFLKTWRQHYGKYPHFDFANSLVEEAFETECETISELAERSVILCCDHLGLKTDFRRSSVNYPGGGHKGVQRVIDLCKAAGAKRYLNAPGGRALYRTEQFSAQGVKLLFLSPLVQTRKAHPDFATLSVLHVLANLGKMETASLLSDYELECGV